MYFFSTPQDNNLSARYPIAQLVYEGSFDPILSLAHLAQFSNTTAQWQEYVSGTVPVVPQTLADGVSLTPPTVPFAGWTNWISNYYVDQWGANAGQQEVALEYFYTSQYCCSQGNYYFLLNYVQHTTEGLTTGCPQGRYWGTCYWSPLGASEYMNAETTTYPGQGVFQFDPAGSNEIPASYTYTIGVGYPGGASASISYQVSANTVSYSTSGDQKKGYLTWTDTFNNSPNNVLYNLQPAITVLMDPSQPGGGLPMITSNTFTASYCSAWYWFFGYYCGQYSGSAPTISFTAYVYTNSVSHS